MTITILFVVAGFVVLLIQQLNEWANIERRRTKLSLDSMFPEKKTKYRPHKRYRTIFKA